MKIQCDVCNKYEALLFCTADDAALCSACDHRIHHANILAAKHLRFPFLHSNNNNNNSNHFPLCDICQDRRAFLFCQQDRAILCSDCDLPIHSVNELTRNHDRFLLTGVKISCNSVVNVPSSSSFDSEPNSQPQPVSNSPSVAESSTSNVQMAAEATNDVSKYLIEGISDWHFEEFLESSSGFCKLQNDDVHGDWMSLSEDWGIWSPEMAAVPLFCSEMSCEIEMMEEKKEGGNEKVRGGGCCGGWSRRDDGITVPAVPLWPTRFRNS